MTSLGISINGFLMIALGIGIVLNLISGRWSDALEMISLLVIVINTSASLMRKK